MRIPVELKGQTVRLDDEQFAAGTVIKDCRVVFGGKTSLGGITFDGCSFEFEGAALAGLKLLSQMYANGGKDFVERTFESIRRGF